MLPIELQSREFYDEQNNRFFTIKGRKLVLEHSLVSISKWESKYKKPWFSEEQKTIEETRYYIQCMTITQNVPPETYILITNDIVSQVNEYLNDPMTAAKFTNLKGRRRNNGEYITSETIYYWMIMFNIPDKCEKWHINRLIALITMCSEKNKDQKKMSKRARLNDMISTNEQRLKKYKTNG